MDFGTMKLEYETTDISLRALAKKYGVSYSTLQARCSREGWQRDVSSAPELQSRMDSLVSRLLEMAERAAEELDLTPVVTKTKQKTTDGEVNIEERRYEPGGIVDRKELKILTAALKDLRDLSCLRPALDIREQEAKIRALERQLDSHGNAQVTVTLEGETEGFAL